MTILQAEGLIYFSFDDPRLQGRLSLCPAVKGLGCFSEESPATIRAQ